MDLAAAFDRFLPLIEDELRQVVQPSHHGLGTYYGMMRYHLGWTDEQFQAVGTNSGKRIRPLLCLLCCEGAGGRAAQALPAAAAVELIHNFSLVHDDIQDTSRFRRGRPAVWSIWGPAHAINVGDGLFVLARLALDRLGEHDVPVTRRQAAALALDQACLALCEGQYTDMAFEDRLAVDLDQYLWMIRHKTARLLAASAQLGAIVASDDEDLVSLYYRFGQQLGMAFQIQDDILGAWGEEAITGKSAATDIRDKKKTLPVVYALNHPQQREAASQLRALYSQEGPLDEAGVKLALGILERTGAREYAAGLANEYHQRALDSLQATGRENEAHTALRELASSLLGRQA
ncbi:MAG: polyprenyl synthetase family protein [Anaerolineae bacterium]|jgi:geranylgeranyl diphosphate synthase type I